ncbi:acylneuraminate cytidylyltransferase family protein [Acinetobacter towneri]|uniref:acylneuraminate cytidylyltransferase family protein n=1 Tax=Acinetobacter towneri TaxID=202956 RepID=UPI00188A793A|nr:acylneuraminate cytidylyltransferase family protein [Acinetobacter towneri]MBF4521107.1 acylneuraminate cytidylyltransferase family protein [Acinetobacter towneri]
MKLENKFLAIILARGGSKRLPRKNILPLAGKPMISWTIEAALKSPFINKVVVSSDDTEILEIAHHSGADVLKRPKALATDTASSFDAIEHVIENNSNFEYIVLLQPTSPLRTTKHIDEAITVLETKKADAVISVSEADHSPLWMNTLTNDHSLKNFLSPEIINSRSQDLPQYYRLNGAIYICKTKKILREKTFFISENIYAYVMEKESSIDIDTEIDFKWASFLLSGDSS